MLLPTGDTGNNTVAIAGGITGAIVFVIIVVIIVLYVQRRLLGKQHDSSLRVSKNQSH